VGEGKNNARGTRAVILAALLALSSVAAAGYAYRDRLVETYWIWRLDAGARDGQAIAAARLGEIGSTRAIEALADKWRRDPLSWPPLVLADDYMESSIEIVEFSPVVTALVQIGAAARPAVKKALESDNAVVREEAQRALESIERDAARRRSLKTPSPDPIVELSFWSEAHRWR
jgi:hypothetical protein